MVSHKEFQQSVIEMAVYSGWLAYHTYDSRRSEPGFPDLTLVRRGRIIFAELKVGKDTMTPTQKAWTTALAECHAIEVYEWRDTDWDEIERVLVKMSQGGIK